MPQVTVTQIAVAALAVIGGAIIGWILRARRCAQEKTAVNAGWQAQIEAQRTEHERLVSQNKGLMQQVSQFQASQRDATNRAKELSEALKESFQRRDELQRDIKDARNKLQSAVAERDKLKSDVRERAADEDSTAAAIRQKDDKIFRLSRELENWQNRLPPLLERFRERDREATALEEALDAARERIVDLENLLGSEETRVEPVDREALGDDIDASNDPNNITQTGLPDVVADDDVTGISAEPAVDDTGSGAGVTDDATDVAELLEPDEDAAFVAEEASPAPAVGDTGSADVEPEDTISPTALVPEALLLSGPADDAIADDDDYEIRVAGFDAADDEDEDAGDDDTDGLNHHEPRGGLRDNLKLIKGVGPAIEKTLNELGIFRFNQIAEMSEYDIDRVARRLKGFRSRIYREDWIGQARDLQEQKATSHH